MHGNNKSWGNLLVISFLLLISFTACNPKLERPGVPIWLSVRVGADLDTAVFAQQLDTLRQWGFGGIVLEAITQTTPETDTLTLDSSIAATIRLCGQLAYKRGIPFSLALSASHPDSVFRKDTTGFDTLAFFVGMERCWKSLILPSGAKPLPVKGLEDRFIGTNMPGLEKYVPSDRTWLSGQIHCLPLEGLQDLNWSPALGIIAAPAPDGNSKAFAQQWHSEAAALSQSSGKPIFLVQANLLGQNRLEQLQNHLRFWPKDVWVRGIVLNTIYTTPSVLDDSTHFGLANDPDLIAWLRAYMKAGEKE